MSAREWCVLTLLVLAFFGALAWSIQGIRKQYQPTGRRAVSGDLCGHLLVDRPARYRRVYHMVGNTQDIRVSWNVFEGKLQDPKNCVTLGWVVERDGRFYLEGK